MSKKYTELASSITASMEKMGKEIPHILSSFEGLMKAATEDGALSKKTKVLMALALGIGSHCDGCIAKHVQTLVKLGMTRQELLETIGVAVFMGGGPSMMYATDALAAFEEYQ